MEIAIISDEISYDFHTAFELGEQWGINLFELRCLGPDRLPDHDPVWTGVVQKYVKAGKTRITALSPGLFKLRRSEQAAKSHIGERFTKSLELAEELECRRIILFAFVREEGEERAAPPDDVLDILRSKGDQAEKRGIELAIETIRNTFADTGKATRLLMEKLDHPAIKVNWDPGNTLNSGDTSPLNGYHEVSGLVSQVHVKDTDTEKIVVVGEGDVDWPGQLEALSRDGFQGILALETHLTPRLTETKKCLDAIRKMAEKYR